MAIGCVGGVGPGAGAADQKAFLLEMLHRLYGRHAAYAKPADELRFTG